MTVQGPGRARPPRILVSAASMHGATADVAAAIGRAIARHGFDVTVLAPERVGSVADYDAFVIGSAIYVGHWLDPAKELVSRCAGELVNRPVWLFSSGPVGNPAGKLAQAMAKDPVEVAGIRAATHARDHRMFAGRLDRKLLTRPQRASLLVFRGLEGDFRDWTAMSDWADGIARQLTAAGGVSAA